MRQVVLRWCTAGTVKASRQFRPLMLDAPRSRLFAIAGHIAGSDSSKKALAAMHLPSMTEFGGLRHENRKSIACPTGISRFCPGSGFFHTGT